MSFYSLTSYSQLRVNQTALSGGTPTPPSFADTKSFQFDGITDRFIGVGNYSELDGQNKATFSFWIKPPSTIVNLQVIASVIKNATQSNHQFQIRLATNATVQISMDTGSKYIRASSTPLNLNAWNHVLFCFDTTQGSASNRGIVFINGVDATSATSVSGVFSTATGGLYIAENQNGQYDPFEGLLNEVAIWSGSDQRANVSEIYNGGLPNDLNNLPTAPHPTTWQRMGEDVLWNGFAFTMTDVNGGYVNRGIGLNASDPNPTTDVPLFDNKSFAYDGVSDAIEIGTTSLGITNAISVSAWVKIPTTNTGGGGTNIQVIIAEDPTSSGQRNWNLFWRGGGIDSFYFVIHNTNLSSASAQSVGVTPNSGQWIHILATYDGTANANGIKLYIDGVLNAQGTASSTGINSFTSSEPNIGRLTGQNQWNFEGNINDVSVFDNDQSANALTIFNGGLPNDISALSPLGYWRAEQVTFDGTDWTLIDQGSGGNNGTSVSMPLTARTSDVPLFDNKSFTYDGIADYVNLGDNNNLSFGDGSTDSPFSISAWIKIGQTSAQGIVTKYGSTTATREYLFYTTGGKIRLLFIDANNGANNFATGTTSLSINTWYHVCATYDGSGGSTAYNGMTLYINGISESVATSGGSYTAMSNTSQSVEIGKYSTNELLGNINDTSIFNTELTQSQVTQIYNGGIANDISNLNPLSYWRSEFANWDGSNWTMIDQGSGANNGLTSSMPLTSRTSDVPT